MPRGRARPPVDINVLRSVFGSEQRDVRGFLDAFVRVNSPLMKQLGRRAAKASWSASARWRTR